MKSFFFPCHMCGSYDSNILTPAFLADGRPCNFQKIVICKKCGLVYKNPVIPELNELVYDKYSWSDGALFQKRILDLTEHLSNFLKDISPKTILEIGPGPGWLAMSLQKLLPDSKYILFEVSMDVAQLTQANLPNATVIPASIEEATLQNDFVNLAIVCGVDYLFADFRSTIEKIYNSLSKDGYIYIERNVFVETEAYAWFPIKTLKDLFGQNILMTTWFAVDQYKQFLNLFFDIISERSFLHDETDGYKCQIEGFLCKKKTVSKEFYDGSRSWYEINMRSLNRLIRESLPPNSEHQHPTAKLQKVLRLLRYFDK